jgi:hypothetical protein
MRHQRTRRSGLGAVVLLLITWIGATSTDTTKEIVRVPTGKVVMVDGKIEPGEWSDAAEVKIPGDASLYLKSSGEFVYLAVRLPEGRSGFTDLYVVSEDGGIYDLHASAKLGERQLQNGKWPEWSNWWNNQGWVANVSQVESFEKRIFAPTNIREYQLERSRFRGREWRLMLDMSVESRGGEYKAVRFPASASDSNPEKWLRVQIEP